MLMTVVSEVFGSKPSMDLGSLLCEAAQRSLTPSAGMLRPGEGHPCPAPASRQVVVSDFREFVFSLEVVVTVPWEPSLLFPRTAGPLLLPWESCCRDC